MTELVATRTRPDIYYLYIARALRGFGDGFAVIILPVYLVAIGLSPLQVAVCTIVSDADDYARKVQAELEKAGLIAELDLRNEKIGYKVREHSLAKVPVVLAVGKRDQEGGTVALRYLGEETQKVLPLAEAPYAATRLPSAIISARRDRRAVLSSSTRRAKTR